MRFFRIALAQLLAIAALSLASHASASNIASDAASNYTSGNGFDGANGGSGFGSWTVDTTPSGSFGTVQSGAMGANEPGSYFTVGFTSGYVGDVTATRSLTGGVLQPGQSFDITTAPAQAKTGTNVGFSLQDSSGNTLFSLFVEGGSSNNFYTDLNNNGTKITPVTYNFEKLDNVVFTLLDAVGDYQLTISGSSVTGGTDTITGAINNTSGISQFQLFYNSSGANLSPDEGQFNNLAVSAVPEPSTLAMLIFGASAFAAAAVRRRKARLIAA